MSRSSRPRGIGRLRVWCALWCGLACAALSSCKTILFQEDIPNQIPPFARMSKDPAAPLRAGSAEADITPGESVYLGGYGLNRTSLGVDLPLKARALVVEQGGVELAFVAVDLLGMHRDDIDWIKRSLDGFVFGNVLICSTHTHAGPDLMGLWGFYFLSSGRDEEVLRIVRRGVRQAVLEARARLQPCTLRIGQSRLPDVGVAKNNNRPGWFDRDLTVLAFDRIDGKGRGATLIHFGCHPEMLRRDNRLLSSDMTGDLCDQVTLRTGSTAVFINGALGAMVTPSSPGGYGPEARVAMRERLVALVAQAEQTATPVTEPAVGVRRTDVYLPVDNQGFHFAYQLGLIPRSYWNGHVRTSVGWYQLGPLRVAAIPGEIEPALASRIQAGLGGKPSLVFALADDELGYLMTKEDAESPTFRYERSLSPCADAGDRLMKAVLDLSRDAQFTR